jgi:hypothetical protein
MGERWQDEGRIVQKKTETLAIIQLTSAAKAG